MYLILILERNSNTTLVKVKSNAVLPIAGLPPNSNTTLVKVK